MPLLLVACVQVFVFIFVFFLLVRALQESNAARANAATCVAQLTKHEGPGRVPNRSAGGSMGT